MIFLHEVEDTEKGFKHRVIGKIRLGDTNPYLEGKWVGYETPATLVDEGTTYVAVTPFYSGTAEFPNPDKIYVVMELEKLGYRKMK